MEGGIPPIVFRYGKNAARVMNSFTQVLVIGGGKV